MNDLDNLAHAALVLRCQGGDRVAMEDLYTRHHRALGYYLRRMLGQDEVADLQQEVWLTVLRRLRQLRNPEAFVVWLYQIARRKAWSRIRERDLGPVVDAKAIADLPEDAEPEFSAEDAEAIHHELASLSSAHREVIVLRFLESMTYEQIAEVTDCGVGTVRSRLHYAKLLLRQRLEEDHERR